MVLLILIFRELLFTFIIIISFIIICPRQSTVRTKLCSSLYFVIGLVTESKNRAVGRLLLSYLLIKTSGILI